ncbi:UNVERIFIED_CONTAM: hypothetical protein Cloal_3193 [Acetivibrio alkalicellulosi]
MDCIIEVLENYGPMTGKELQQKVKMEEFYIWKACNDNEKIITKTIGKRYLRFDKVVDGYARLSPSLIREFYSYTVIGTKKNYEQILSKAASLEQEIIHISKNKFKLAHEVIKRIVEGQENSNIINKYVCFLIAGDVVFEMAHLEPRPESSTGRLVKGSDLDIVVITKGLPDSIINSLDLSIYNQKNFLLKNPSYNEEIDYVIKDISKVREQLKFNNFKFMIASKVLYESKYLYGSLDIYNEVKKMVADAGIPEKIAALEEEALINRNNATSYLLKCESPLPEEENLKLFYTKEEKEEFF